VHGLTAAQVGDIAFEHGVRLHELTVVRASLEEAFMELTADSVEFRADPNPQAPQAPQALEAPKAHQYSSEGRI
jgi:ABC-2 type transport system ATP-binding protein